MIFKVQERLSRLREIVMETPAVNEDLRNIVLSMSEWQWNMSAAGFFHVNRSIVGGVSPELRS